MGQMRLPWARASSRASRAVECGHPGSPHYANGLCAACYTRDYAARRKAYKVARTEARLSAPIELTCYNRDSDGVCLGHPYKPGPVYHE